MEIENRIKALVLTLLASIAAAFFTIVGLIYWRFYG